jgi:hypothetical protein
VSKRVILICLLLCVVGFFSGWQLCGVLASGAWKEPSGWWPALVQGGGFMCLPAGVKMLMGYRSGRVLASMAFAVGYLGCAALLAAPLLPADWIGISINGNRPDFGVYATVSLLQLGVLLFLHWTLFSPPFEEHLS